MTLTAPAFSLPGGFGWRAPWGWQRCFSRLQECWSPIFTRRLVALLVGWAFVWPHFARQLSCRAASPHQQEEFNLKIDAIIAGLWIGVMGMSALPTAALVMMVGMNMMGSGAVVCLSRDPADSALRAGDAAACWARGRLQPRPRGVELNASRTGALSHAVRPAQPPHRRQACGT